MTDHGFDRLNGVNLCGYLDSSGKANDNGCTTSYYSICVTKNLVQNRNNFTKTLPNIMLPTKCPTESGYYKLINNTCYYYERQTLTYRDAQYNCQMIFGLHGHLFEPKTEDESKLIYNRGKDQIIFLRNYCKIMILA